MKKKLFVLLTLLVTTICLKAQTQKDWYIIGAKISDIGLDFQEGNTAFSFDLTPRVAWFIKDNLAVGAEALIGLNTSKGFTSFSYGIGPVARYYLASAAVNNLKTTRWFLDGNVGFNGNNTKVSGSSSVNTNGLGIGFGPGLAYFLNQNIALEALAKYNLTVGFGNSTTNNAIDIAIGFQIHLPRARLRAIKNDLQK